MMSDSLFKWMIRCLHNLKVESKEVNRVYVKIASEFGMRRRLQFQFIVKVFSGVEVRACLTVMEL